MGVRGGGGGAPKLFVCTLCGEPVKICCCIYYGRGGGGTKIVHIFPKGGHGSLCTPRVKQCKSSFIAPLDLILIVNWQDFIRRITPMLIELHFNFLNGGKVVGLQAICLHTTWGICENLFLVFTMMWRGICKLCSRIF